MRISAPATIDLKSPPQVKTLGMTMPFAASSSPVTGVSASPMVMVTATELLVHDQTPTTSSSSIPIAASTRSPGKQRRFLCFFCFFSGEHNATSFVPWHPAGDWFSLTIFRSNPSRTLLLPRLALLLHPHWRLDHPRRRLAENDATTHANLPEPLLLFRPRCPPPIAILHTPRPLLSPLRFFRHRATSWFPLFLKKINLQVENGVKQVNMAFNDHTQFPPMAHSSSHYSKPPHAIPTPCR